MLEIKSNGKNYGFLRCSEEAVLRFKGLAPKLGYKTMKDFLDDLSRAKLKDLEFLNK